MNQYEIKRLIAHLGIDIIGPNTIIWNAAIEVCPAFEGKAPLFAHPTYDRILSQTNLFEQ